MVGIYKITNPKGRVYVGQSVDIEKRIRRYKVLSVKTKGQTKIWRSLKKYGVENHTFEVLLICNESQLNRWERFFQEMFDCVDNGLNCRYTKSGDKSGRVSKETLKRMSEAQKGNNNWLGRKHSDESKEKIRQKATGRKFSKEVNKKKASRGSFGIGKESWSKGKFGKEHPKAKAVVAYNHMWCIAFDTVKEAAEYFGRSPGNISSCCKGKLKTAYGYKWKYKNV